MTTTVNTFTDQVEHEIADQQIAARRALWQQAQTVASGERPAAGEVAAMLKAADWTAGDFGRLTALATDLATAREAAASLPAADQALADARRALAGVDAQAQAVIAEHRQLVAAAQAEVERAGAARAAAAAAAAELRRLQDRARREVLGADADAELRAARQQFKRLTGRQVVLPGLIEHAIVTARNSGRDARQPEATPATRQVAEHDARELAVLQEEARTLPAAIADAERALRELEVGVEV